MTPDALPGLLLLLIAVVGWYVTVRIASNLGKGSPTRLAVAFAMPAGLTCGLAAVWGQADVVFAVPIGCAVAALTLVRGVTLAGLPATRRSWQGAVMLLPVTAVVVLFGLRGAVPAGHALLLLIVGLAALWAWRGRQRGELRWGGRWPELLVAGAAVVLAGAASTAALVVLDAAVQRTGYVSEALLGSLLLAAMLVLPMVGVTSQRARLGRADEAISALHGYAILLLGVALPIGILITALRPGTGGALVTDVSPWLSGPSMPWRIWRLDAMLLLLLAMLTLPRWRPGRWAGLGLVGAYVGYVCVIAFVVRG